MNYNTIQEPGERISNKAVKVWRISSIISHVITIIIISVFTFNFDWPSWLNWILYGVLTVTVLHAVYGIFISPTILQRTWRFGIDAEHIQLKYGIFNKHHLIVPMTKVQYVNSDQGPLLRKYGLSTLTIGTIASSHEIPALPQEAAKEWRDRIVYLANITASDE